MLTILSSVFALSASLTLPPKDPRFACEGRYECFKRNFTGNDKMLCDGYRSCFRSGYKDTKKNKAVCNGYQGCEGAIFYSLPLEISCRGFESCINIGGDKNDENFKFGVSALNKIDCSGVKACTAIDGGINAKLIVCDGDKSCFDTKITSLTDDKEPAKIVCNGKKTCANSAQIRTDGNIYCDGDTACENSRIQATTGIACHGKRVCKNATLQISSNLDAYGMMAAAFSTINQVPVVKGYGFMSLAYATISNFRTEPRGLRVYGWGYKALWKAQVTCLNDILCEINCLGNGCQNLVIYAQQRANLTIDPPECLRSVLKLSGAQDYFEIVGKFADPAVKRTHCPGKIIMGSPPDSGAFYYKNDPEYFDMKQAEAAFNAELEREIQNKKQELEDILFLDATEKLEEERAYLYGDIGVMGMEHSSNYMIIGWVSLAVVLLVGFVYSCYACERRGEYKALSS